MTRRNTSARSLLSSLRNATKLMQRQGRLAARLMQLSLRAARPKPKPPAAARRRAPATWPAATLPRPSERHVLPPLPVRAPRPAPVTALAPVAPPLEPALAPAFAPALASAAPIGAATFLFHTHVGEAGTRRYKAYVPARATRHPPLLVMLHGCTQDPDDFAKGTRANRLADEVGCVVIYPEQTRTANPNRCWNWFAAGEQRTDGGGEAAVLIALVHEAIERHGADPRRVYAAGMSAGGAMAALLAALQPSLFAAIGVHSGLPAHAATDVGGALRVMRHGVAADRVSPAPAVPTIIFHGDHDRTVNARNGDALAATSVAAFSHDIGFPHLKLRVLTEHGQTAAGRAWTRVVHRPWRGPAVVEQWVVHGSGHAWSGGAVGGSHTDPGGPDATASMWAFFARHAIS